MYMEQIKKKQKAKQDEVLSYLKDGGKTRGQLVKLTGIPRTTIHDLLKPLFGVLVMKEQVTEIVEEVTGYVHVKKGRPKIMYSLIEMNFKDKIEYMKKNIIKIPKK